MAGMQRNAGGLGQNANDCLCMRRTGPLPKVETKGKITSMTMAKRDKWTSWRLICAQSFRVGHGRIKNYAMRGKYSTYGQG